MSDETKKAARPPKEVQRGAVQPEKPTKLPNVAQPRPTSTTTSAGAGASKERPARAV